MATRPPSVARGAAPDDRAVTLREELGLGVVVALLANAAVAVYAVTTWDAPGRGPLLWVLGGAFALTVAVGLVPERWLLGQRLREPFFVSWSLAYVVIIGAMSALDGGATSPLVMLLFLPVVFAGLAYPLVGAYIVGGAALVAYVLVGWIDGATSEADTLVIGSALAGATAICVWSARRQGQLHLHLIGQRDALAASDLRERRRARQQAAVAELGQRALRHGSLDGIFDEAASTVAETLEIGHVLVLEHAADAQELRARAAVGWPVPFVLPEASRSSQCALALGSSEPVVVADAEAERRFDTTLMREHGVRSGVAVAVTGAKREPFGVVSVHAAEPRAFLPEDVHFVRAVANVLSGAVTRAAGEEALRHRSLHDELTGLPNRTLLVDRLSQALRRAARRPNRMAVLFCDLDQFKVINDGLGHAVGDELLGAVADRLREVLRAEDTLARFGGDEFVILCEDLPGGEAAVRIADRVLEALREPFRLDGIHECAVSASIGVALGTAAYATRPDAMLRDADAAMYRAKAGGGARVEVFDDVTRTRVLHQLETANALRVALDRDELFLAYQPVVDLATGSCTRAEALLRWRRQDGTLVSPADFIPIAEQSGTIISIGAWVVDEVCRQMAEWRRDPTDPMAHVTVGLNLSARQLSDDRLRHVVADALERHGIPAEALVLELTETALIQDPEQAGRQLAALHDLGVRLSLDDFGTGYSSLSHLKQHPLAAIKLDRLFISGAGADRTDTAILRSVVQMADSLGLATVAEGIETEAQAHALRGMGCRFGQGFLFARPIPPAEFEAYVADHPEPRAHAASH